MSPAAAEAAELALWTGRLAYADPAWELSCGPSYPARPAEVLAPEPSDVPEVVAAIHHASEAVAQLATANLEQARSAVRGGRVLVPTRVLPENYDIPSPYTPAPASYQTSLLMCCQDTSGSARQLADAVAGIAIKTGAPSRTLAAANQAVRPLGQDKLASSPVIGNPRDHETQSEKPGPIESELRGLGVTNPRTLWRAAALDRASRQLITEAAPRRTRREERVAETPTSATSGRRATPRAPEAPHAGLGRAARTQPVGDDLQAEA
jgi:hypothetical protein